MTKWILLGFAAGFAVRSLLVGNETSCCQRVADAARDKIAGAAGPFSGAVSSVLDATGLTGAIPGLLDVLGVPK